MAQGIANQTVWLSARTRSGWRKVKRVVYDVESTPRGLTGRAKVDGEMIWVKCAFKKRYRGKNYPSDAAIAASLFYGHLKWTRLWTEDGKPVWDENMEASNV